MSLRKIELFVICVFLFLEMANFIGIAFPVRIVGQNLINHRLWAFIMLFLFMLRDTRVFVSKPMLIVYLYILIYLLLYAMGHYDLQAGRNSRFALFANQHIPLLFAVALGERFRNQGDSKEMRILLRVALAALFVASLASIIVTILYPQAVRGNELAFIRSDESIYRKLGLGGYDLFTGLPFILPLLVFQYKSKLMPTLRKKWFWAILIVVYTYCVYKGAIVAPFFMAVILLFLAVLGRRRFSYNKWPILGLLLLVAITPGRFWGGMLNSIGQAIPNNEIQAKVYDLGTLLNEGASFEDSSDWERSTNRIEGRLTRVTTSLQVFARSPLIGVGSLQGGLGAIEHVFWFALFAQFGILGAFSLIWLFVYSIRRNLSRFDEEYKYYYLVSVLGFIALGFAKVIGGWFMYVMIFFIVPNMCYFNHQPPVHQKNV